MFSFLGGLYTGVVTVDPNSTSNAWYTNLLFGIQCYTNGYFTPNRPASSRSDKFSSTTYWNSEQSASSGTTNPKNWGGCDFAYTQFVKAFFIWQAAQIWLTITFGFSIGYYLWKEWAEATGKQLEWEEYYETYNK